MVLGECAVRFAERRQGYRVAVAVVSTATSVVVTAAKDAVSIAVAVALASELERLWAVVTVLVFFLGFDDAGIAALRDLGQLGPPLVRHAGWIRLVYGPVLCDGRQFGDRLMRTLPREDVEN